MVNTVIVAFAVVLAILTGVDMAKNPQSYRNIPLRFGDACRSLYFWPSRLAGAYMYMPRHSTSDPLPEFMRSWHLR